MTSPIEFKLFAPNNQAVSLIGSFSGWTEISMQKGNDGYFRTHVDLEDGSYQYKFRVQSNTPALKDQWVDINDPYMTAMDRKTENGIVRVKSGERLIDTYVWQHDDRSLPINQDLVIYELHITDFCGDSNLNEPDKFKRAIAKLDHLTELGVNTIALMPITEYAGNYRWGYMVRYYFAPESSYGKPEDLKQLIDECHARGIRVILDGIYNHTDDQNPLLMLDRDYWYYHDRHYPDDDANYWGPEFNYTHYDDKLDIRPAWSFVGDVVRFWIQEYHIDGIRYDAVRQLADYEFCGWLMEQAKQAAGDKPFYNIAEHIPDTSEIVQPKGVFDGCWHESFRYFLKDIITGGDSSLEELKSAIDARQQGYSMTTNVINYLASHDREHMLVELADVDITGEAAFQRVKLAAVLQLTAPGIPMLWMGDEFGQPTRKAEVTSTPNPLDWSLLEQDLNHDLFEFYKRLIALRHNNPALRTENIEFFYTHSDHKVLAFVRWTETGDRLVVILNFSAQSYEQYSISAFPADGVWRSWTGEKFEAKDNQLAIDLPSFGALILIHE
ncbi:DUF3459 domain-containing protein [Phormidesmis priestleyi ULC007]|uniref:DUF3459 domain-containing protein n=1 Tax=Phormidesmis priestleyi ULC007 TaxID=1920490 RepID=A0A2T1DEP2_9CYAN|nr:alpha-amylase family glycosyl hydrolase [Phormidesmis priestleyi]PSB18959.1 DUF3459 domain-containing protein [Phormidesmis priestleyi ULC007]PZO53947.1 MAG: DUF3459 domain-containing protein [Phormidesmis priestleyi]